MSLSDLYWRTLDNKNWAHVLGCDRFLITRDIYHNNHAWLDPYKFNCVSSPNNSTSVVFGLDALTWCVNNCMGQFWRDSTLTLEDRYLLSYIIPNMMVFTNPTDAMKFKLAMPNG